MLGTKTSDALIEVYLILYYIAENPFTSRQELSDFITRYRVMKSDEEPNAERKPIVVSAITVSRQIAFIRKSFNVEIHSSRKGFKVSKWGILNPNQFKQMIDSQVDITRLMRN